MSHTVVLNADYSYLNTVGLRKALKLLIKGKAEVLKEAPIEVCNFERTCILKVPIVLRLIELVKTIYRSKLPYTNKNVFVRDGYKCQYCGSMERKLTIDHVIPQSRGGRTNFLNCVASCFECNTVKKRNRTPEEAGMKLMRHPYEPTIMDFLRNRMKIFGAEGILNEIIQ